MFTDHHYNDILLRSDYLDYLSKFEHVETVTKPSLPTLSESPPPGRLSACPFLSVTGS